METRCFSKAHVAALGLGILLAAAPARSADYCINTFSATFVAKGFKLPKRGKCAPWHGFCVECPPNILTGSACTAADGSHVRFSLLTTTDQVSSVPALYYVQLELPSESGEAVNMVLPGGSLPSAGGPVAAQGQACKVDVP